MIVIDVGCAEYGGDFSIRRLVDEFAPEILYGFDPNPAIRHGAGEPWWIGDTKILIEQKAAWTEDGEIGYLEDGLNSCLTYREDAPKVPCVDLATFITELWSVKYMRDEGGEWERDEPKIILKMDAEGSEYDVLPHLMLRGADELLDLAIIEWHERGIERAKERRNVIEKEFACPIREWPW